MKKLKMLSLFDGSGGFPLAGMPCGIETISASEIEPFAIRVSHARFPNMKHLGSVTEINGGEIEPVDIVTFGSPCVGLSMAGLRKGLFGDERSNLFFEAIRIIKEMRTATNGEFPRFCVWENVEGARSSAQGDDFRCAIESICRIADESVTIPRPQKWDDAGFVRGGAIHWLGVYTTRNIGPAPHSGESGSTLLEILQENVPTKYCLSARAAEGIIRRSKAREKTLPQILKDALMNVIETEKEAN